MADLEAPIARGEDLTDFGDFQASTGQSLQPSDTATADDPSVLLNGGSPETQAEEEVGDCDYGDVFSGSLEDLVSTFDDKIISCFRNYDTPVADISPVQMPSPEQMLNESPTWRLLTEKYGNVLPVDWHSSHARALQLAVLDLPSNRSHSNDQKDCDELEGDDDDDLANDLDLHSLILNSHQNEPLVSVEQVLQEIDDIMREQLTSGIGSSVSTTNESSPCLDYCHPHLIRTDGTPFMPLALSGDRHLLSVTHLNEVIIELERMIQSQSEVLINELAHRDELEFEKELRNSFISLILSVQNRKRQLGLDIKRPGPPVSTSGSASMLSAKYLTTVIPYAPESGTPDVRSMQVLIKILKAMSDDSPAVPTLLTDYILKVLCPG